MGIIPFGLGVSPGPVGSGQRDVMFFVGGAPEYRSDLWLSGKQGRALVESKHVDRREQKGLGGEGRVYKTVVWW